MLLYSIRREWQRLELTVVLGQKLLCAPRHAKESHMHMLKTRPDMVDVKPVDDYTSYHANHE